MVKCLQCEKCAKVFNHTGKYKKHLLSHEQLKPHKCPQCGISLSAEWVLKRHLETKHSGVKPYTCFQCNSCFTSKDHLHRHLNTRKHTPFVCEKCSKEFRRINAFHKHRCSGVVCQEKSEKIQENFQEKETENQSLRFGQNNPLPVLTK